MNEVLNNLSLGEVLYTTSFGTKYIYRGRANNEALRYSINSGLKYLPLGTILTAFEHHLNGIDINAQWYRLYDPNEYRVSPCNLSVLRELLVRTLRFE